MGFNTLRAIANRLTATPIELLPQQIGFLSNSLSSCKDQLSNPTPTNDESLVIHKLKTKISSLLQDRSPEGRLCGIIIAKALIENGGYMGLAGSASWARALISCLSKPDSVETKRLCIITITRLYMLTADNQTLIREITTPTLTAFFTTSLSLIRPVTLNGDGKTLRSLSPLLDIVLRSWYKVIQAFPGTCRPHVASIKAICLSIISDFHCHEATRQAAINTLSILHLCAPKNNGANDWLQLCQQTIEAIHDTADLAFRAVIEDWVLSVPRVSKVSKKQKTAAVPSTSTVDTIGLDPWSGITQACGRMIQQFQILQGLLTHPYGSQISIPYGAIIDMTGRLNSVSVPTSTFALRTNNEITKEERDELWLNITQVHAATIELFTRTAATFGSICTPALHSTLSQVWDVFEAEQYSAGLRRSVYNFIATILPINGYTLQKSEHQNWSKLVQACCKDLIPDNSDAKVPMTLQNTTLSKEKPQSNENASGPISRSILYDAAHRLLPRLLQCNELQKLSSYRSLRTQMDQTAIFLQHEEAILSSILNSFRAKQSPSLLPFFARLGERNENGTTLLDMASEALLRPRFPVILTGSEPGQVDGHSKHGHEEMGPEMEDPDQQLDLENVMKEDTTISYAPVDEVNEQQPTTKRDFTALLEQSTDAQLADSNFNGAGQQLPVAATYENSISTDEVQPELKKPRLADEIEDSHPLASDRDKIELVVPQESVNMPSTDLEAFPQLDQMQSDGVATSPKGKEKVSYDSDSDGSEIPAIDATLAGFTDDEDEE